MTGIDLNKSDMVGTRRNMCVEKKHFGWSDDFINFPQLLRVRIHDSNITEYLSFNLKLIEGESVIYQSSIIIDDTLLIIPLIPEDLKNAKL